MIRLSFVLENDIINHTAETILFDILHHKSLLIYKIVIGTKVVSSDKICQCLWHVGDFIRVHRCPPQKKLTV